MPLGIISDAELEQEINNSIVPNGHVPSRAPVNTVPSPIVLEMPSVGRIPDVKNVPASLRKILGEEVIVNGLASAKQLASQLGGISQPTLSTYAQGKVSPGSTNDDMLSYVEGRKNKITKRALNKLNSALSFITEDKLVSCDVKELSSVAKDMASVVKNMEPAQKETGTVDPVQFHFYAPQVKQENHYEVVTAKDNY